jgi:hypothetical protein
MRSWTDAGVCPRLIWRAACSSGAAAMRCYYLCSDDGHKGCLQAVAIAMHKILATEFVLTKMATNCRSKVPCIRFILELHITAVHRHSRGQVMPTSPSLHMFFVVTM